MRFFLLACLGFSLAGPLIAEPTSFFQQEGVTYDPDVPTPEEMFGFGWGDRPVAHHQMVAYLSKIAEGSDRISMETIGYSHEGRPILFFVVTSPYNHNRLDHIRTVHDAMADPEKEKPEKGDHPAIVWINYGVHGAEASGMDAVMPTLYHLAAADEASVGETLKQAVILITAIFNPDGHTRRIDHVTSYLSNIPVTDPAHEQHDLWLKARTNHYWFDLNRQWLLQTQPESRAWLAKWHEWKPHLTADFHEMGANSTYYFHPGVPARRNPLVPDEARDLAVEIAGYHARALDAQSRLYFSEEGFDNFYVGKGSTYPQVNGSVGFLFEAGTARGGLIETPNGLKRYGDMIHHHYTTSLSTIEGAVANRVALRGFQTDFFETSLAAGRADNLKAYLFQAPGDAARAYHFLDLLRRHDVRVYALAEDVTVDGVTYRAGQAYAVPMAQRQYVMIKALFEHVTEFEEEIFYDVSGWTMPAAYDLDYAPLQGRRFRDGLLGQEIAIPDFPQGRKAGETNYGYIFEWAPYYAPRALYRLLDAGIITRSLFQPADVVTDAGTQAFDRGAIFVPFALQTVARQDIKTIVDTIAAEDGIDVYGVTSGLTPTPGVDLGGRGSVRVVEKPSVLLLIEGGITSYDAGEIWHLLDTRMAMPVTMVPVQELGRIDWSRYTHIILSGGRPNVPEAQAKRLAQWVQEGGTLVGVRQGALWAEQNLLGRKDTKKKEEAEEPRRFDYAELGVENARDVIGGSLFVSDLDITHPLGFGYHDRRLPSHKNMAQALKPSPSPIGAVAVYQDAPLLSGYASDNRLEQLAGTPMMVHERLGAGAVVLYADNPNFRGTMFGTTKLFMNSLFFSTLVDRARRQ